MKGFKDLLKKLKFAEDPFFTNVKTASPNFNITIDEHHPGFSLESTNELVKIFSSYFNKWVKTNLKNINKKDKIIKMMEEFCDEVPTKYKDFFPKKCKIKDKKLIWELNNGLPAIKISIS